MTAVEDRQSLECIRTSELYPKKALVCEDGSLSVPFPLLSGECVEFLGRIIDGVIALSNFRLLIRFRDSFANIPLGLVEQIEAKELFNLHVSCKDATVVRCVFSSNDTCLEWFKHLSSAAAPKRKLDDTFAFAFFAWCQDGNPGATDLPPCYQLCHQDECFQYSFGKEVERMKFDLKSTWRISYINEDFKSCPSYPKHHIVPAWITDDDLKKVAGFRSLQRFPSVVWRDQRTGAVIVRCSQPELGWLGWRNQSDENLLEAIPVACAQNSGGLVNGDSMVNGETDHSDELSSAERRSRLSHKNMLVIDARSYSAAFANRAKGGGCECAEYYPSCEIQFMSLANIHTIRNSFLKLRALCAGGPDQANWLSSLENTKWLHNVAALLKTALTVVHAIDIEGRPVLVHCSDGWDRTPQIAGLSQLLLDPYYRTIQGFRILVEREWLEFGHKFADRCGHSPKAEDTSERCPVFMQWLDCVHQVVRQFPCAFEFNEAYLVKLVQHTYSCLFGTFLCNNVQERLDHNIRERTASLWSLLKPGDKTFINYLYSPKSEQVLRPSCHIRNVVLWKSVYLLNNSVSTSIDDYTTNNDDVTDSTVTVNGLKKKNRSLDDIIAALEHSTNPSRRLSDSSLKLDQLHMKIAEEGKEAPRDTDESLKESSSSTDSNAVCNGGEPVPLCNGTSEHEVIMCNGGGHVESESDTDSACNTEHHNGPMSDSGDHNDVMVNGVVNGDADAGEDEDISILEVEGDVNVTVSPIVSPPCVTDDYANDSNLESSKSPSVRTLTGSSLSLDKCHMMSGTSSTDTLMDSDLVDLKSQRSDSLSCVTELVNGHSSTHPMPKSPITKLKSLHNSNSISTSTSDISDSKVIGGFPFDKHLLNGDCAKFQDAVLAMKIPLTHGPLSLNCDKANCESGRFSTTSLGSGPSSISSSSRSSTCPPTPGTDGNNKISESPIQRQLIPGLGRHLDCDGLTTFLDPTQVRVEQIKSGYDHRVETLEHQLYVMKMALIQYQYASGCNGTAHELRDEILSLPPESIGSDLHSLGSNPASDVSWEQIDERDSSMTLWVPDHAVTHCAGCESAFWVAKRRHHCRNCGKVFCADCTNHSLPIPQQQLRDPSRVCTTCFSSILQTQGQPLSGRAASAVIVNEEAVAAAASD